MAISFKKSLLTLFTILSLQSTLLAEVCYNDYPCNRFYIGAFGGGLYSNASDLSQMGTAFFSEVTSIGPLAIYAHGPSNTTGSGFGGVQLGYEWVRSAFRPFCSGWCITPAAEVELYFFSQTKKGDLHSHPTSQLAQHVFVDSFHMDMGVGLVNALFSLYTPCWRRVFPYIGGGIGVTHIFLSNGESVQIIPDEPDVNHFNSKRSNSAWTFAAQAKAGLQYDMCRRLRLFAEYRYLFVDSSKYILGSTVVPGHPTTSPWNINVGHIHYNGFAIGIQYSL